MTPNLTARDLESLAAVSMAIRAPAFAAVTMAVGVGGHLAAGGVVPGAGTLALLALLVALSWRVTARQEQSLARLVAAVEVAQLAVHHGLAGSSGHAAHLAQAAHLGHEHGPAAGSGVGGLWMVTAHAIAGAAVAWWLRRGEVAAWHLLRLARRLVRSLVVRLAGLPPLLLPVPSRPEWPEAVCAREVLAVRSAPRRGPPITV